MSRMAHMMTRMTRWLALCQDPKKFTALEFYDRTVEKLRMRHSNCSRHDNIKFAQLSCIENTSHCQVFM